MVGRTLFFVGKDAKQIIKVNLDNYEEKAIGPADFKVNDFAVVDQNLVLLSSDGKLCRMSQDGVVQGGQQAPLDEVAKQADPPFECGDGWTKVQAVGERLAVAGYSSSTATNYLVILDKDLKYKTHTNIPCTDGSSKLMFTKRIRSSTFVS